MINKPKISSRRIALRQVAHYRLVIYFKEGSSNNPSNRPRVFFSYPFYDNMGDMGKFRLWRLVTIKYRGKYITALLYNNVSGLLIKKWVGSWVEQGRDG